VLAAAYSTNPMHVAVFGGTGPREMEILGVRNWFMRRDAR
jgi:hypothetical protein